MITQSTHSLQVLRWIAAPIVALGLAGPARSQLTTIRVVDMIPQASSGEVGQDAEPNIAVNPADPLQMVASAFTSNPTGATNLAPIFVSTNGGTTWQLNNIVPSGNGRTGDISVRFADRGGNLYTGILLGGAGLTLQILRTANPMGAGAMTLLVNNAVQDQPYVQAATTDPGGGDVDRVYVGYNDFGQRSALGGTGRTATEEFSLNARIAAAPAGFAPTVVEARATFQQDMPAVRTAVHSNGTVYAVFYRWTATNTPSATCDVIVVRDDTWGAGGAPFTALTDPGDASSGRIVVTGVTVPAFPASLGSNRLVASNLSIAVNPNDSRDVWIAWADNNGSNYTLHVRRSTNAGATWSGDLRTVTSATNPALAVNSRGRVGFLYQQFMAAQLIWRTTFDTSTSGGVTWGGDVLASTRDDIPAVNFFIGDYADVMAVGETFHGVFSATNIPLAANFPQGVTFQRNVDMSTGTLLNTDGVTNVNPSIDPFYFQVSYLSFGIPPCLLNPSLPGCYRPILDLDLILLPACTSLPCFVTDPIPQNCLVKWDCPGCDGLMLCPPWFHIFLDDLDPRAWEVRLFSERGEFVDHVSRRTESGVVLSFRPSKREYRERDIGDYVLGFEALDGVKLGTTYRVPARIEATNYPLPETMRGQGREEK